MNNTNASLTDTLLNGQLLSKAALAVLCCMCLYYLLLSLRNKLKRRWESVYFILLCAAVFIWALCDALVLFAPAPRQARVPSVLQYLGLLPVPALLCLHIWQQVSYKERRPFAVALLFAVPAFLSLLLARDLLFPRAFGALAPLGGALWHFLLFYLYAGLALLQCYLLCLNVFYQMPRRMRRSTRYMLLAVSSLALLLIGSELWQLFLAALLPQSTALAILLQLAPPLAFGVLLYPLYSALHMMPASDIIVTSREFVMGGLDTVILVLNRRRQILDWNLKDWAGRFALPKPLFREPFEIYRERLLKPGVCRVSPHNENIIIASRGDAEAHYWLRTHGIGNRRQNFGSLVEITDVTQIYTLLRHFEGIAHFDVLTGLHNRNAYFDYLKQITTAENMPLLIFVGDVNGLKRINDIHGHLLGDQLIKTVADIIRKGMPPGAFAARVGGDEFVVLVPHSSETEAQRFVQNIIALCAQENHEVIGQPSISWGFAVMRNAGQSYNDLFSEADAMMYAYKKGRHQFSSSGFLPEK